MPRQKVDILVAGAGLAGLIAANAFARAGFSVLCVDPAKPRQDRRTTAFLQPAARTLERAGLWQALSDEAEALQVMRLADAGGGAGQLRYVADFDASEISDAPFGWNLQNARLRDVATDVLATDALRLGVGVVRMTPRAEATLVRLSDGSVIEARLIIAADGRNSAVRTALNIPVQTFRYGQKALVFSVHHETPHHNVSTEIHRSGGPFTLVPLPDVEGRHTSSVVWMDQAAEAARLDALSDADFLAAVEQRACGVLGKLHLASDRQLWPIIGQLARHLTGPRTALVAEAAHVVPPIGAQGLNMSLADVESLLDLAIAKPNSLGSMSMLDRFARMRWPEISARVLGVDALNRASIAQSQNLRDLRLQGLKTLHQIAPIRQMAMRSGLGV